MRLREREDEEALGQPAGGGDGSLSVGWMGGGARRLHNSEREEPQVGDRWLCEEELGQGETRTCGV